MPFGQKVRLVVGIAIRFGASEGSRAYQARYDLDHDGVIDVDDLAIAFQLRTCHGGGHHWF